MRILWEKKTKGESWTFSVKYTKKKKRGDRGRGRAKRGGKGTKKNGNRM